MITHLRLVCSAVGKTGKTATLAGSKTLSDPSKCSSSNPAGQNHREASDAPPAAGSSELLASLREMLSGTVATPGPKVSRKLAPRFAVHWKKQAGHRMNLPSLLPRSRLPNMPQNMQHLLPKPKHATFPTKCSLVLQARFPKCSLALHGNASNLEPSTQKGYHSQKVSSPRLSSWIFSCSKQPPNPKAPKEKLQAIRLCFFFLLSSFCVAVGPANEGSEASKASVEQDALFRETSRPSQPSLKLPVANSRPRSSSSQLTETSRRLGKSWHSQPKRSFAHGLLFSRS